MANGKKDIQSVTRAGESTHHLIDGVMFKELPTHVDDRGVVFELFDERWGWQGDPLVYSYCFTVRPNKVKGWAVHAKHIDRYYVMFGEMLAVLYDAREDSPTYGMVNEIYLSEHNRRLVTIPIGVWHADQNVGTKDVIGINFPTRPYEHEDPDKYRLSVGTEKIPYTFKGVVDGW